MATLVLLNGPPASGKSTIAARLVGRRPLALNLDLDVIRSLLGEWKARLPEAGIAVRRLALVLAREHLGSGRDVIVPQFLAKAEFIDQLAESAESVGARFVEIALMINRADAVTAFERRSAQPESAAHRDAFEAVTEAGGVDALTAMHDRYMDLLQGRTSARRVEVSIDDIDGTVANVESAISALL